MSAVVYFNKITNSNEDKLCIHRKILTIYMYLSLKDTFPITYQKQHQMSAIVNIMAKLL
jgi:hypothetical protein